MALNGRPQAQLMVPVPRTAREMAELYYTAALGVRYAENLYAMAAAVEVLLQHDPGRLRFEVWCQNAAADVVLSHSRDVAAGGNGVIISGNAGYIESWRDNIDTQCLALYVNPGAAVNLIVKTWTLMQ